MMKKMKKVFFPVYALVFVTCLLLAVSCNKNTEGCGPCKFEVQPDSVSDADGNLYSQVKIGKQTWLGENVRTTHFADGSRINNLDTVMGARCFYPAGGPDSVLRYGLLYNWAAARQINDSMVRNDEIKSVCPNGYHLPTDKEWGQLVDFVKNCTSNKVKMSAAKMLAAADSSWRISQVPNTPGCALDSNNMSCFGAMPAGHCFIADGTGTPQFFSFHSGAYFWSATPFAFEEGDKILTNPHAYGRYIGYNEVQANKTVSNKKALFSVRCVKD